MKRNSIKGLSLLLTAIMLTFAFFSCKATRNVSGGDNNTDVTTINPSEEDKTENSVPEPDADSGKEAEKHKVEYTVFYYDIIDDKDKSETQTADISEKTLPPSYIIESISDLSGETVGYHSVKIDKDKIYVDFDKTKSPFVGAGSSGEAGLLNGISKSLLYNYKEINEVYFTADGEEYSSGHFLQPKDEPYMTRKKFEENQNAGKSEG